MTMRYSTETQTSLDQHRPVTSAEAGVVGLIFWKATHTAPHKTLSYGAKNSPWLLYDIDSRRKDNKYTQDDEPIPDRTLDQVAPQKDSKSSADPPDDILQQPGRLEQILL
jgi:hypothetical protein